MDINEHIPSDKERCQAHLQRLYDSQCNAYEDLFFAVEDWRENKTDERRAKCWNTYIELYRTGVRNNLQAEAVKEEIELGDISREDLIHSQLNSCEIERLKRLIHREEFIWINSSDEEEEFKSESSEEDNLSRMWRNRERF